MDEGDDVLPDRPGNKAVTYLSASGSAAYNMIRRRPRSRRRHRQFIRHAGADRGSVRDWSRRMPPRASIGTPGFACSVSCKHRKALLGPGWRNRSRAGGSAGRAADGVAEGRKTLAGLRRGAGEGAAAVAIAQRVTSPTQTWSVIGWRLNARSPRRQRSAPPPKRQSRLPPTSNPRRKSDHPNLRQLGDGTPRGTRPSASRRSGKPAAPPRTNQAFSACPPAFLAAALSTASTTLSRHRPGDRCSRCRTVSSRSGRLRRHRGDRGPECDRRHRAGSKAGGRSRALKRMATPAE